MLNFLQHHEEQITHMPTKTTFFDPRMLPPEHNATPYSANQMPHPAHYQQHHPPMSHAMVKFSKISLMSDFLKVIL